MSNTAGEKTDIILAFASVANAAEQGGWYEANHYLARLLLSVLFASAFALPFEQSNSLLSYIAVC